MYKGITPRNQPGAWVAWGVGEDGAPQVHLLDPSRDAHWRNVSRLNVDSVKATAQFFGPGMCYAVPCDAGTMELMALNYAGAHCDAVRALCAHIALGRVIGATGDDRDGGGTRVAAPKPAPRAPRGGGATFNVPAQSEVAS